jgi:hypothetical protein
LEAAKNHFHTPFHHPKKIMSKQVGFVETDPLVPRSTSYGDYEDDFDLSTEAFVALKQESFASERDREDAAADRLSMRLLSVADDDEEEQFRILRESFALDSTLMLTPTEMEARKRQSMKAERSAGGRFWVMVVMMVLGLGLLIAAYYVGAKVIGPPKQPLGPYQLVERQVCFFPPFVLLFFFKIFTF